MSEREFELRPIGVDYLCDKCGGPMEQTGIFLPVAPPKWRHQCTHCGDTADLSEKYPAVRYRRVEGSTMKAFRYPLGHEAGQTMTVVELRNALAEYPDDMPVFAEWEGCHAYIRREAFSTSIVSKGHPDDACECLVIGVESY